MGTLLLLLSQIISPERSRGNYVSATITLPLSQVGKAPDFDSGIFAGSSPVSPATLRGYIFAGSLKIKIWTISSVGRALDF